MFADPCHLRLETSTNIFLVTASYSEKSYLQSVVEEKMQKLQSQPKQIPPTASITVPIPPPEFLVNEILQKEQELKRREEQLELKRKANEEALARAKKKSFSPSNKIDLSKHLESSSSVYGELFLKVSKNLFKIRASNTKS